MWAGQGLLLPKDHHDAICAAACTAPFIPSEGETFGPVAQRSSARLPRIPQRTLPAPHLQGGVKLLAKIMRTFVGIDVNALTLAVRVLHRCRRWGEGGGAGGSGTAGR